MFMDFNWFSFKWNVIDNSGPREIRFRPHRNVNNVLGKDSFNKESIPLGCVPPAFGVLGEVDPPK